MHIWSIFFRELKKYKIKHNKDKLLAMCLDFYVIVALALAIKHQFM